MKALYDTHSMPQTADNVAAEFAISRADQDAFAWRSQQRCRRRRRRALCRRADSAADSAEKGEPATVTRDEHPRPTPRWNNWRGSRASTARN